MVSNQVLRYRRCGVQGAQALLPKQLGKARAVASHAIGLLRRPAGRLVLAVAIPWRTAEDRHDDLWPEPPDDPHYVLEDRVPRPVRPRVVERLGEPEVIGAGEELLGAVELPGGQELFGPQEAERFAELRTDEILPPSPRLSAR